MAFQDVDTYTAKPPGDDYLRRLLGGNRVLYGTDAGPPTARQSWKNIRTTVPLTDEELRTIAGNVAPYLR